MIQTTQNFGFENHNTIFLSKILWSTVSKAFFKSINTAPTNLFLFISSRMISETSKTAVVVEKSFLKPDCLSFKYEFLQIQKLDHVLSFQKISLV